MDKKQDVSSGAFFMFRCASLWNDCYHENTSWIGLYPHALGRSPGDTGCMKVWDNKT